MARQPIFTKDMKVYGYELLYRASGAAKVSGVEGDPVNGNVATSETILNSFQHIGIEKLTGGKRAFVNFTEDLILLNIETLLPNDTLVIELLEGILPTEPILEALSRMKSAGYLIALDDFIATPDYFPYFQYADIVKFDFLTTSLDEIRGMAGMLLAQNKILLAEKIENAEIYEEALQMGFSLFQGYYFSKPATLNQKKVTPLRANCFQLMSLSAKDSLDFGHYANVIRQDVALSYSLLKLVNSPYFGMTQQVKGIRHAISILGEKQFSKWVVLMTLSRMNEDKPDELVSMSLMRGRILEAIAKDLGLERQKNDMFLLGLLSLIDVLTDTPMKDVLNEVKLNDFIGRNLIPGGEFHELISLISHYDKGDWDETERICKKFGLPLERINEEYLSALDWARDLANLGNSRAQSQT